MQNLRPMRQRPASSREDPKLGAANLPSVASARSPSGSTRTEPGEDTVSQQRVGVVLDMCTQCAYGARPGTHSADSASSDLRACDESRLSPATACTAVDADTPLTPPYAASGVGLWPDACKGGLVGGFLLLEGLEKCLLHARRTTEATLRPAVTQ